MKVIARHIVKGVSIIVLKKTIDEEFIISINGLDVFCLKEEDFAKKMYEIEKKHLEESVDRIFKGGNNG